MAKRARGSSTRPGQRRPIQRTTTRTAGPSAPISSTATPASIAPRPAGLTDAEEARAAELEAAIVAEERAATEGRRRSGPRRREEVAPAELVRRTGPGIAVRAAEEYAYVGRDVRRITILGGSLLVLLFVLFAIQHATGAGPI